MDQTYKCSIVANPKGRCWRFANEVHDYVKLKLQEDYESEKESRSRNIAIKLGRRLPQTSELGRNELLTLAEIIYEEDHNNIGEIIELNRLKIKRFRDREHKPKVENNLRECNVFYFHDPNLHPDAWLAQLLTVEDAIRSSSPHKATYVMPYKRFMRQERKDESRTSITTRAIAKILNEEHNRVLTIDIHSDAIPGNYRVPFDTLYSFPVAIKYLRENHPGILQDLVVVSPDAGGGKRAEVFSKRIGGRDVVIGYKYRPKPGVVGKLKLSDFNGKKVLIIDDILDSGGTLIEAAKAARKQGAEEVYGYVTHPLFTKGYDKIIRNFDRLFVGNTIRHPRLDRSRKIEVISFTGIFGEAIYRINRGDSISALLD